MTGAGALVPAVLLIGAAAFLALETMGLASRRRRAGIDRVRAWVPTDAGRSAWRRRQSSAVGRAVARLAHRVTPAGSAERLGERIAAAGLGGRLTVSDVLSMRLVFVAAAVLLGLAGGTWIGFSTGAAILTATLLAVAAYILPGTLLARRAKRRADRIEEALPDALDLLAVTVEAGLGLYGAIVKLIEATGGPLTEEFALVLAELRVGESSEGALTGMARRIGTPGMSSFVRAVVHGDKLGLSLARTLRAQADDARRRRRTIAEERAAKAPVKMLFPAAFFIFPALFVVILGPGVLSIARFL